MTAIDRGESQIDVVDRVETAMAKATDLDLGASDPAPAAKSKVSEISGLHKTGDLTLKRRINTKPRKPDPAKQPLKKLPGKKKPPVPEAKVPKK